MARVVKPIQATNIATYKPKDKDYTISDGNGLQLLIKTNGTKIWEFVYLSPTTLKRKKISLGVYHTKSNTLKTARDKRANYQKLINDDVDVSDYLKAEKEKKKQQENELKKNHSIQKILDDFYIHRTKTNRLKEITVTKDKARVENHFIANLPKKAETSIHDINYDLARTTLKKIENKEKLETLRKVKAIVINVFKYAYAENIISNAEIFGRLSVYSFVKPKKSKNNPTFTKHEDIKKLYSDILSYEKNLVSKYLLITSIHTAQRQGAIITAKWCDINFKTKVWVIPKEFMKGTASFTKDHHLPLSNILINHLKELKKYTGDSEYLFPNSQIYATRNKRAHISNNTARSTLRALGYSNEQQTAHGLRAMFKTVCKENQEEHNLNNEFVERVLAHKVGNDVENAYNRAQNIEEMRKVLNWWSEYLEDE